MIKVLGKTRILLLLLLLVLNALFGAVLYMYLLPEKSRQERALSAVRSQVNIVREDLAYTQQEFDQLEFQRNRFDQLRRSGFFNTQKRRQAEEVFEQIQRQSGVLFAKAAVGGGQVSSTEESDKAEHKILKSPIEITLEAFDDVTIYNYIYLLENFFPGHIAIEEMTMRRKQDVTGGTLRAIAGGANPILVTASIKAQWETMIPKSAVVLEEGDVER